jgi:hypothetical protein
MQPVKRGRIRNRMVLFMVVCLNSGYKGLAASLRNYYAGKIFINH